MFLAGRFSSQPFASVCKTVLVKKKAVLRNNTRQMDVMKCIIIVALWIYSLHLVDVAAATSTTTLMRPPSEGKMSDHRYGSKIVDGEEDGALEERPNTRQYQDEEPSQLKLEASNPRRADQYYQRYKEMDLQAHHHVRKSKEIPAKRRGRSAGPQGELLEGTKHLEYINEEERYGNSTMGQVADIGPVQESRDWDRVVAAQQITKSPAALIKNGYINVDYESNPEATDRVLQQPPEDESMGSWSAGRTDAAGQRMMKSKKLPKKKKPLVQQYPADGKEVAETHDESKSDNQNRSAKGKQPSARMIDGGSDFSVISSATPSSLTTRNRGIRDDQDGKLDAGNGSDDFYDIIKAQTEEEVVMAEESQEDKQLIPEYNLGEPIKDWDLKRLEWRREHPEVKQEQLFILTGTQPWPCTNAEGDHLLLRCFKNKVDYSRIHGVGLFYNTALLDAHMPTFWAKLPVVRATMLAHPEVEWIWWLDADAIITDMEFSIPLHRYTAYNLVVHGWESLIFEKRSWLGLNAGSFLLRNCQWSLELLERWACMGPKAPMGDAYRYILSDFLPDRPRNPTDDQAALVYLLIKEPQRWAGKLRVELDFFLSGYWLELMDGFEATEERYRAMEEQHVELLALLEMQGVVGKEKLVAAMGRAREQHLSDSGASVQERRPFITHFTGCQPCSGNHNNIYSKEQCRDGLIRALNYGDDQVLRTLGYQHRALLLPDVLPNSQSA